jgi:site-specific DNA-cytosine methylase
MTFVPDVSPTLLGGQNRTGGPRPPGSTVDNCDSLVPVAFAPDVADTPSVGANQTTGRWGECVGHPVAFDYQMSGDASNRMRVTEESPSLQQNRIPAVAFQERGREGGRSIEWQEDCSYSLNAPDGGGRRQELNVAVGVSANQRGEARERAVHGSLAASKSGKQFDGVRTGMQVRRLTPKECERLQGLPDNWTLVPYRAKPAADGPRYKAIGNGWCRPVFEWVFGRLTMCAEILEGNDG